MAYSRDLSKIAIWIQEIYSKISWLEEDGWRQLVKNSKLDGVKQLDGDRQLDGGGYLSKWRQLARWRNLPTDSKIAKAGQRQLFK